MKKGFGILFIVLGVLNLVRSFAILSSAGDSSKYAGLMGQSLFIGIGLIGLGIWMVSSSKRKTDTSNLPEKRSENDNQNK